MSKPHLADVAREAGVSVGAASLALSGRGRISETTRARVREVAARLGYAADPVARAMRVGHLPLVGLVLTDLADPADFDLWAGFWSQVLAALSVAAARRKYGFVLIPRLAGNDFSAVPMAGYALVGTDVPDSEVDAAVATGAPVLTDTLSTNPAVAVRIDLGYEASVGAALDHLVAAGAHRPGLLGADPDTRWGRAIEKGRSAWERATGLECPFADASSPQTPGATATGRLLDRGVDAIVTVFTDPEPLVTEVARRGLSVGTDVRLVAIDEDFQGHFERAGVTTVSVGMADLIDRAVSRFLEVVEGTVQPPVVVDTSVTVHARPSSVA